MSKVVGCNAIMQDLHDTCTFPVVDDHFTEAERAGKLVKDTHPDEHATCYIVKDKGLVVISSCGHTGIINTVRSAMKAANVYKVHAVMGGFHLGPANGDYLQHSPCAKI